VSASGSFFVSAEAPRKIELSKLGAQSKNWGKLPWDKPLAEGKVRLHPAIVGVHEFRSPKCPAPLSPTFPVGLSDPFETLNVDGGVTNNDRYN
jgi:hypothetical protein